MIPPDQVDLSGYYSRIEVDALLGSAMSVNFFPYWGDLSPDVVYWLGTGRGTRPWVNPHSAGEVAVTLDSIQFGQPSLAVETREVFFGTGGGWELYSTGQPNSWQALDLKTTQVRLTHFWYRLLTAGRVLRDFRIEGSNDGVNWSLLAFFSGDDRQQLGPVGHSLPAAWPVTTSEFFSRIRVVNVRTSDYYLGGVMRLYGEVR